MVKVSEGNGEMSMTMEVITKISGSASVIGNSVNVIEMIEQITLVAHVITGVYDAMEKLRESSGALTVAFETIIKLSSETNGKIQDLSERMELINGTLNQVSDKEKRNTDNIRLVEEILERFIL